MTDVQQNFGKALSRAEMMVKQSVRKRGKANSTEKLPPLQGRNEIHISSNDNNRQNSKPSHAANFLNKVLDDENPKPTEQPTKGYYTIDSNLTLGQYEEQGIAQKANKPQVKDRIFVSNGYIKSPSEQSSQLL